MTSPATQPPPARRASLRALVIEPDDAVRLQITGLLQRQECEVHACRDYAEATRLYDLQEIVVAAVSVEVPGLQEFVERVRATSGEQQPFILGIASGSGVTLGSRAADYGMDDALPFPLDSSRLTTRLNAIVRLKSGQPLPPPATAPHDGWTSPASQVLLEQLPDAVAILDTELKYIAANDRWRREFQLGGIQLTGQSHYAVFPDLHPAWRDLYSRCLAGHRERMEDDVLVRPDGSQDWVRWDVQPWQQPNGQTGGLILACTVVTGDRRNKVQTAFERNLVHSLLNAPTAPIAVVDTSGRLVRLNDAARRFAGGLTINERQTFFWNVMIPPDRREAGRQRLLELLTLAAPGRSESWPLEAGDALTPAAAKDRTISWKALPHRRPDGTLDGLILLGLESANTDAAAPTAPTAAMTADLPPLPAPPKPSAPADEFRQIAEAAPFAMIVLNEDAELLYANPQHAALLGFSIAETGSMTAWLERACAADEEFKRRALDDWWERVWRRHGAWTCSMRTAGGMLKELEFRPSQLPSHHLLLTIFDVTDTRLEEQALRASEARYRGLFQHCAAGVATLNSSGNITEVNSAFEQITGYSRLETRRMALAALLPEEDAAYLRDAAAGLEDSSARPPLPTTLKSKDGTRHPVALSFHVLRNDEGVPVYTSCFFHPLPAPPAPAAPASATWRHADWSLAVPDCVLLIDANGLIHDHSDARDFATLIPAGPHETLAGHRLEDALPAIADLLPLDVMVEHLRENPAAETRCDFTTTLVPGGRPHHLEARMIALPCHEQGTPVRYGLVLHDATRPAAPAPAPAAAAAAPGSPAAWVRNLTSPVILANERGRITALNPAAETLLGHTTADLEGSGLFRLFRPDNPKSFSEEITAALTAGRCWKTTSPVHRRDGSTLEMNVELVPAHDETTGARGFITLLHEPATAPAGPQTAAAPAPSRPVVTLHRARNDLQVLSSLLSLHAERTTDPAARLALLAGKDRLTAVSLIYRLINGEQDTVDFARYAAELGRSLLESHRVPSDRVKIETSFDAVQLPQKTAISLGLILEELLSASLTDSFPGETGGTIRLSLTTGGGEGVLIVRDNGTLLTEALRTRRLDSFSWAVVQMLSTQIGGVLTLLSDLENQVRLRFRLSGTTAPQP